MNLSITPQFTQAKNIQNQKSQGFNILAFPAFRQNLPANSNLAPLARDTISFSGKQKVLNEAVGAVVETVNGLRANKVAGGRIDDFNYKMALELERSAEVPMGYFQNVMNKYFKKFVSTENGDDRIIQNLGFRIKTAEHIDEKLNSVGFRAKQKAIEKGEDLVFYTNKKDAAALIDDIIGGRIVLRDSSRKSVKKVLQILGQIVKDGKFKVKEIESFRPLISSVPEWVQKGYQKDLGIKLDEKKIKAMTRPDFFNYADNKDITELADICRKKYPDLHVNSGKDLPNGYQAIHVNIILPDGSKGEIQIMGRDIENFKDLLEDAVYKKKCNKKVDYAPLDERLQPLADKNEEALQIAHTDYTRWTYIGERLKAVESFAHKPREKFLTAPKSIKDRGLGYNQILPLARAAKAEKKAQEAAKAKKG